MANAVYRSSSSARGKHDRERPRANTRLSSAETEARTPFSGAHEEQKTRPSARSTREELHLSPSPEQPRNSQEEASRKPEPQPEKKQSRAPHTSENTVQEKRGWPLYVTPSLLLMFGIFELVTLSFFFLFGLIVGKGSVPPPRQAELEQILPADDGNAVQEQDILPQEALQFMASLKSDELSGFKDAQSSEAQQNEGQSVLDDDSNMYDFVLRVAAFRNEDQADTLRARLEGKGLRTRLAHDKGKRGTWHLVHVLYRGTEVKMQQLRKNLSSFGLKDSIVLSKTQVRSR